MWARMPPATAAAAVARRFGSAVRISTSCRRRATRAARARASASGRGRASGRTASAKWASTAASRRSVLASRPVALAKSRTWRGLTTATGRPAAARAATTGASKPPVASRTTRSGWQRGEPGDEGGDAGLVVGHPERLAGGAEVDVEVVLGDVDADEHADGLRRGTRLGPALRIRCGSTCLFGLRGCGGWRGGPRSGTGFPPRGAHGLPRHPSLRNIQGATHRQRVSPLRGSRH